MDAGGPAIPLSLTSDPAAAAALLDPHRRRILESLSAPASAAAVARELSLPRQKVNYYIRELERLDLVRLVEERKKGNCTERLLQASAAHYVVDPSLLGDLSADPASFQDRFSWAYLVAIAARAIRELAVLSARAKRAKKKLQTFSLHADVAFDNAESLSAFTEELANELARLTAKHQSAATGAANARTFRFFIGAYPAITKAEEQADKEHHS